MATTFPVAPSLSGQLITVDRLVNDPVLIYRTLRTLAQQRLIGHRILSGRVDVTGSGSAVYEIAESIFADASAEIVDALMEYPLTVDGPGSPAIASTSKWGLATEIPDELVARNRTDLVSRKLIKLANRIAFQFDALVLSAVASAVTQTQAVSAAWSTAGADQLLDVLLAAAQSDSLNQGYSVDTIVLKPVPYARLLASTKVLDHTPREGAGAVMATGNVSSFAGLTFLKSTNLPAGVEAMVLDSTLLGSIAYEGLGGGYTTAAAIGDTDPGGVESKTMREDKADGWRVQARKIAVPMVQEPGAAVKLTGV